MEYSRFENNLVVRLDKGDEICDALLKIAEAEQISCAAVTGIGATDNFCVGVFDIDKKAYDKYDFKGANYEITSLCGNLTRMNGKAYQHLHMTCAGSEGRVVGGHLLNAVISLTCEITLSIIEGSVSRQRDASLGINKISFE